MDEVWARILYIIIYGLCLIWLLDMGFLDAKQNSMKHEPSTQ